MALDSRVDENDFKQIITFYSYKGGVGRTMALANTAVLLARHVRASGNDEAQVLMIDWDVEAPGLHRFFTNRIQEPDYESRPGLMELMAELDQKLKKIQDFEEEDQELAIYETLQDIDFQQYTLTTDIGHLRLLEAGRFDETYGGRVNSFRWDEFHRRTPSFFRIFASWLSESYLYVLIDSRTGLTDTSGICTTLMPEKLVVVFTPNRQSLTGLRRFVKRATEYRTNSSDMRPLIVYPLPSRIEASLDRLRSEWRSGNEEKKIEGYEPLFQDILQEAYGLKRCDLREYFEEVQIQQTPEYAYGEDIAVLTEAEADIFSLSSSFKRFTDRLVLQDAPWASEARVESTKKEFAKKSSLIAERAFEQLSPSERDVAEQILRRLLSITETGGEPIIAARPFELELLLSLRADAEGILKVLTDSRVVYIDHRKSLATTVRLADDDLIRDWPRLRELVALNEDRIVQLQELEKSTDEWIKHSRSKDFLLVVGRLDKFQKLKKSGLLLSSSELEFLEASTQESRLIKSRRLVSVVAAVGALAAIVGGLVYLIFSFLKP